MPATWRVLLPARMSESEEQTLKGMEELEEVRQMLAERVKEWTKEWRQEEVLAGRLEGIQEGLQQGMQQGIEQGVPQGESRLLRRLLTRRFGALPSRAEGRLAKASCAELEAWGEAVLEANDLDEVFRVTPDA